MWNKTTRGQAGLQASLADEAEAEVTTQDLAGGMSSASVKACEGRKPPQHRLALFRCTTISLDKPPLTQTLPRKKEEGKDS